MTVLIAIALKSLLVAGATLLVLRLMKGRSAAERSTVAGPRSRIRTASMRFSRTDSTRIE